MRHQHNIDGSHGADQEQSRREADATRRLLEHGAADLQPRPWRPEPTPPSAVDLTHYALWRSSQLTSEDLKGALSLLRSAREEVESVEAALLFVARAEGLTWAQIAEAMDFRSPQACQQYVSRLSSRQGKTS